MDTNKRLNLLRWFNKTGVIMDCRTAFRIDTFFSNFENMWKLIESMREIGVEAKIRERKVYELTVKETELAKLFAFFKESELSRKRKNQKEIFYRVRARRKLL